MVEEVGVIVRCAVCGRRKKPIGRSAPIALANALCDDDCKGYREEPYPGQLWPGETREEFGF